MVVESPIKPEILAWVIEESGYAPDDLARKVGLDPGDLREWSGGESTIPKGPVNRILKELKRSPDIVYLDQIPEDARLMAHFRTMKVANGTVSLTPREIQVVREAHYVQYFLEEMFVQSESWSFTESERLRLQRFGDIQSEGAKLRGWVEAVDSSGSGRKFDDWRALVEARSIFVLMLDLKRERGQNDSSTDDSSRMRGFSLAHDIAPLIVVCTDNSQAKTFTLFHELAHLAIDESQPGACHVPIATSDATERWCDRVAGAALLPPDALKAFVARHRLMEGREDRMVDRVAREFEVSKRAAAVALEDSFGLKNLYRRTDERLPYRDRNPRNRNGGGPGWDRVTLRFRKYGRGMVKTIFEHFARGDITESHVRDFLNISGDEVFATAHRVGVDIPH